MPFEPQVWRKLLEAVYEMNAAANHADFGAAVVAGLQRLIEADITVFQVLNRTTSRILFRSAPNEIFTAEEVAYYTTHSEDMPLVAYYARTGDTEPRRLSDVVADAVWLSSDYYRNCQERLGLKRCLGLPVAVDDVTVVGLSFNRRELDFSDDECALLGVFAPHLRQAWRRHDSPWAEGAELAARRSFRALGLSPRESEVLFWMTEGKQNREIAMILGISILTVQEHVANLLAKLQQENRHVATVFALNHLHTMRNESPPRA